MSDRNISLSLQLPKIYPLTDISLSGLSHSEQVQRLIAGGSRFIQIREKELSPKQFYNEVLRSIDIARETGTMIIVNDRVDIALAAKAHGVHLGQHDLPITAARRMLGEDAIIGQSTHNFDQAAKAALLPVDYIAFGPIFLTATKKDPDPVVGLDKLRQIREVVGGIPLVAIGGIKFSNLSETLAAGADSVALISELYTSVSNISIRYAELAVQALALNNFKK